MILKLLSITFAFEQNNYTSLYRFFKPQKDQKKTKARDRIKTKVNCVKTFVPVWPEGTSPTGRFVSLWFKINKYVSQEKCSITLGRRIAKFIFYNLRNLLALIAYIS